MENCICSLNNRNGDGLFGLIASGTEITGCYTTYGTIGYEDPGNTIANCYWGEEAVSEASTGELCYKLNEGRTEDTVWHQTLGEDAYPIPNASHMPVIKNEDGSYGNTGT